MMTLQQVEKRLRVLADPTTAEHSQRFFKTGPGEYGEGDRFRGIHVPVLRKLAREFRSLSLEETIWLLHSKWHEQQLLALLMMVNRFARADEIGKIASFYFIKQGDFSGTLKLSTQLLNNSHDLMHKAVGWMLREVGKRDLQVEEQFLTEHYNEMPRTMLRYAIEKFPEDRRQAYLRGTA